MEKRGSAAAWTVMVGKKHRHYPVATALGAMWYEYKLTGQDYDGEYKCSL